MKIASRHELTCLDACAYADFAASRDDCNKNVWYASIDGGTFRVLPEDALTDGKTWTLIYSAQSKSGSV